MIPSPIVSFHIPGVPAGAANAVSRDTALWNFPLVGNSAGFVDNQTSRTEVSPSGLTIGDYFLAAKEFLLRENCQMLMSAMKSHGSRSGPEQVELWLEKHGAFYHPLRVVVKDGVPPAHFVLNGAVSKPGLSLIEKECSLLSALAHEIPSFIPRIDGSGMVLVEKGEIGFFLGQWFEGFREFHITSINGVEQIGVWESNGKIHYLDLEKASLIYENIAYALTMAYNIDTGEQIFPWHHAAGDFIVYIDQPDFPIKLITVRGYGPLIVIDRDDGTGIQILPSLLFFFMNLTLRMQMDRMDGVRESVFLGDKVLKTTVDGFLTALDTKDPTGDLREGFKEFFQGFSLEQLMLMVIQVLEDWPPSARELPVIQNHLHSHCDQICSIVKNM